MMAAEVIPTPKSEVIEPIIDSEQTTCCVVGGGRVAGSVQDRLPIPKDRTPKLKRQSHTELQDSPRGCGGGSPRWVPTERASRIG
jgi:hypothetical protein